MPTYNKKIVYLSDAQRQELFANGSIVVGGETFTYDPTDIYVTPQGVNMSIGTVSTLPAGSSATAAIRGTVDNPILDLGIPKGADGEAENGLPSGGTSGQVLKKTGSADYAAGWSGMAMNDLSDVSATRPTGRNILRYNANTGMWQAVVDQPASCGGVEPHFNEDIQDVDGYELYDAWPDDPCNPQWVDDPYSYMMTGYQHELYWINGEGGGSKNVYLIDRKTGSPFNPDIRRFVDEYDSGVYVEAPLALDNEVVGFWTGTQAQYDALATKDAHKVYFIQE